MSAITEKLKDKLYLTGLLMILISIIFFLIPVYFPSSAGRSSGGIFMINYLLTAIYFVILLTSGRMKRGRNGLHSLILFLVLFLISAYSLNREMNVFESSVDWFCILLCIACTNSIAFVLFDHFPKWMKYLLCVIAGLSLVIFSYLGIYLFPIYVLSAFAFFALGISLHAFVPLLFCIYIVYLIRSVNAFTNKYWKPFWIGIALSAIFITCYIITWNTQLKEINKHFRYSSIIANNELPSWIKVAQEMPKNTISEKIMKTGIVYAIPNIKEENIFWRMPRMNFESKAHDPLIMMSALLCGPVNVPEEDRIKILKSTYEARHQAQERLWSGEDLITEHMSTKVQLWPKLRLSYSELEIIISHEPGEKSWISGQEAIYTFHLPEGGVVTSLSLWIEGKEEKAMLTTKAKADTAYKTIVGVENRDPSVVHWQEGNTVSVRIFPVLKGESRKFKLGITAPLPSDDHKINYKNIYFDGPSSASATEDIFITCPDGSSLLTLPNGFTRKGNDMTRIAQPYSMKWDVEIEDSTISADSFHFNEYSYHITQLRHATEPFDPSTVYLDINASWSEADCERIYQQVKNKKVYLSAGEESFTELRQDNSQILFAEQRKKQFSLFPFYKINEDSSSLVITKNGPISPVIDDLRNSRFLEQTHEYFSNKRTIRLYDFGKELSPYLKSLKEFRMLQYLKGDENQLSQLLSEKIYMKNIENDNEIPIEGAGIAIKRTKDSVKGKAPDHLMRLFAYNHILQQSGRSLLKEGAENTAITDEAQKAYVVSPFSSLVVLETQKDYDRFDISSSKNSLQNASVKSTGAVPEPQEWMLIILVTALCSVAIIKHRNISLWKN